MQIHADLLKFPTNYTGPGLKKIGARAKALMASREKLPGKLDERNIFEEGDDITMADIRRDDKIWNNQKKIPVWIAALKDIYLEKRPAGMAPESKESIARMRKVIKGLEKRIASFGSGLLDTTSRLNASRKKAKKPKKPKKPKAKKPKAKAKVVRTNKRPSPKAETEYFII